MSTFAVSIYCLLEMVPKQSSTRVSCTLVIRTSHVPGDRVIPWMRTGKIPDAVSGFLGVSSQDLVTAHAKPKPLSPEERGNAPSPQPSPAGRGGGGVKNV